MLISLTLRAVLYNKISMKNITYVRGMRGEE